MTIKLLSAAMLVAVAVTGCDNTDSRPESATVPMQTTAPVTGSAPTSTQPAGTVGAGADSAHAPTASTVAPGSAPSAPVVTSIPTTTAAGMNPPHGQPGHDCAIAVGAPLGTKPPSGQIQMSTSPGASGPLNSQAPPPSQVKVTPPPQINMEIPSQGTTVAGMNPPHGQPGHDCAVKVGAPLPRK